jgi:hypothetical protein
MGVHLNVHGVRLFGPLCRFSMDGFQTQLLDDTQLLNDTHTKPAATHRSSSLGLPSCKCSIGCGSFRLQQSSEGRPVQF